MSVDPGGWRSLHTLSPVVNLIPQIWATIRGYWIVLVAVALGGDVGVQIGDLVILLVFFFMGFGRSLVHWLTLRYRVHEGALEIRTGVLNRRVRILSPDRIQNAELVRNPFHRVSGLVELRLETAGAEVETEGLFSALDFAEANRLVAELDALRRNSSSRAIPAGDQGVELGEVLVQMGWVEIVAHGLSSRRAGVSAILLAVGFEVFAQLEPGGSEIGSALESLTGPMIVAGVLAVFILGWILGLLESLFAHYRYRLTEVDDRLVSQMGLLTRRRVELPIHRVQHIRIDEPLLRRVMGFASVYVDTASGAGIPVEGGQPTASEAVIPMVPKSAQLALLRRLLPQLDVDLRSAKLQPAHWKALPLALFGAGVGWSFVQLGGFLVFGRWGFLLVLLLPLMLVGAWLDWRFQGWTVTGNVVVSREGFWLRRTTLVPLDKVQAVHRIETPLLRVLGLAIVAVRVAGPRVFLPKMTRQKSALCLERAWRRRAQATG